MKKTIYPTFEEALYLHDLLIKKFGGQPGIRDKGLLESALYRPQSGYYETLSEQAAALMQSLAMNHCFVDGNKRIAFALTATFLLLNGYNLKASADEGEGFLIKEIIQKKVSVQEIANWIEHHLKKNG